MSPTLNMIINYQRSAYEGYPSIFNFKAKAVSLCSQGYRCNLSEIVRMRWARNTPDGYADIVFICGECKKDYDNNTLPCCEKCGRLKRNRNRCFCSRLKAKSTKPLSDKELLSQAFSSHLENKTQELEKELSIAKEELNIEREEVAKFQEKSEE